MRRDLACTLLAVFLFVLVSCAPPGGGGEGDGDLFITIATGGQSGVYYPVGSALANVWEENLDANTSVESTGASADNINLLDQDRVEAALIQADAADQAYEGTGAFDEEIQSFTAMASLYPQYVQIVTTEATGIESMDDLRGARVAVGSPNSGVELNARSLLEAYDITYEDLQEQHLSYSEAVDGMRNGTTDAGFFTSGLPNPAVTDLGTTANVRVVPIEGEGLANLLETYSYYQEGAIPPDTYGNEEEIPTVTFMNLLVVSEELGNEEVYEMTQSMFDNIEQIHNAHNAAEDITLDTAREATPIPLHEGAEQYYSEAGGE